MPISMLEAMGAGVVPAAATSSPEAQRVTTDKAEQAKVVTPAGVDRLVHSASGVEFTLHDLRRVYLNRLRENGVSLETAMALTGHRSVATVMKYYREVSQEDLASAVQSIDAPAANLRASIRGLALHSFIRREGQTQRCQTRRYSSPDRYSPSFALQSGLNWLYAR